jgi:integrase
VPVFDESGTLWNFFLHTYEPHRLIGRTDGGKEQIRIAIRRLCTFANNGRLRVLDMTDDLLLDFAHAMHSEGLAAETINTRLSKLRALWRYAVKRKLRVDLPDNERLPKLKRLPVAWTMQQMGELLQACELESTIAGIPAAKFWRGLLLTLYDSGIRIRAALLLPFDCVDGRWLTVPAEIMKNRTEQRFYLHADTVAAIEAIREPARERLFPWPWHKRTLYKRFQRILRRAGLPAGRRDLFHRLRRTSATHLAAAVGLEHACRHLGHSGLGVTMGYIDPTMMPVVRAGDVLPRPVMPGKDGAAC